MQNLLRHNRAGTYIRSPPLTCHFAITSFIERITMTFLVISVSYQQFLFDFLSFFSFLFLHCISHRRLVAGFSFFSLFIPFFLFVVPAYLHVHLYIVERISRSKNSESLRSVFLCLTKIWSWTVVVLSFYCLSVYRRNSSISI